jgi:hypothetical protein
MAEKKKEMRRKNAKGNKEGKNKKETEQKEKKQEKDINYFCTRQLFLRFPFSEAAVSLLVTFYSLIRFITIFTTACHLSHPEPPESTPRHLSYLFNVHLKIFSHPRLGLPSCHFPADFPPKLCMRLSYPSHAPSISSSLIFIARIIFGVAHKSAYTLTTNNKCFAICFLVQCQIEG